MLHNLCVRILLTLATAMGLAVVAALGDEEKSSRAAAIPFHELWRAPKQPIELPVTAAPENWTCRSRR